MSQRCLLFSSDDESSRRLIQGLQELELEIVACPEIFGAVETLARHRVDVVLADLEAGPEANFLLKTVREIKTNKDAAAVAVVRESAQRLAMEIGADIVVTKPINVEQFKYALLTCDRFLASLRSQQCQPGPMPARVLAPPPRIPEPPKPRPSSLSIDSVLTAATVQPSPTPKRDLASNPRTARLGAPAGRLGVPRSVLPVGVSRPAGRSHYRGWLGTKERRLLLGAALVGIALTTSHFVFSAGRATRAFASVGSAGHWVWQRANAGVSETRRSWIQKSAEPVPPVSTAAQTASFELPAAFNISPPKMRAVPSRRAAPLSAALVVPSGPPLAHFDLSPAPATVTAAPVVPESIKRPQPGGEAVHVITSKLTLLGELEPVNLSEEASEELLLTKVQPTYPQQAVQAGLQGAVVLQAWIGQDGRVQDLKLVRGPLLLGQAAYHAVKQWRYKPYLRGGKPMEALTYVTVTFSLPQESMLASTPR